MELPMTSAERLSIAAVPLILIIGIGIGWAGGQGGVEIAGFTVFAVCGSIAFAINWLVFLPSYLLESERYFDLTGSLTYLSLVGLALFAHPAPDPRALLLAGLVAIWAFRLGSFLFARVVRDGSDGRFDVLKTSFPRFFMVWTLQGLWVLLTASCALAAMTSAATVPLGGWALLGSIVFITGFAIEVIADEQKRRFRNDPANRGRFIRSGVWAWSRHPNYFGEIALWAGIGLIALPALTGFQYVTLVSPVFVYVLLTRISGVPLLEARAKKRWGEESEYRVYKASTPTLFPRPPRRQRSSSE
jgi:steroid 5-alpha reductase family enzyme